MSFLDTNCVILSNDILTFVIISYVLFIGSSLCKYRAYPTNHLNCPVSVFISAAADLFIYSMR